MPRIEYGSLRGKNVYIFPEFNIPLENQGLVQVRGLNLDDGGFLGVGKSSLFNGLSRIQFGKSGKDDKVDEIVFDKVGEELEMVLPFRKDGHPYELRQYRKHSLYGNRVELIDVKTGDDILPDEARKHPHTYIRDTFLGVDESTFFNVVYLTQDFSHELLRGKDHVRRKKLTTMFNLDLYDDLLGQVTSQIRIFETQVGKVAVYKSQMNSVQKKLSDLGSLKVLKRKWKNAHKKTEAYQAGWYVSSKELEELQELAAQLKLRYNHQQELERVWEESTDLRKKFTSAESVTDDIVESLQKKFEKYTKLKTKAQQTAQRARRRDIIKSQLDKIKETLDDEGWDIDSAEDELSDIKTRLHHLTAVELPASEKREELLQELSKLPELPSNIEDLKLEYDELQKRINDLEGKIKRAKSRLDSGVCSECGSNLTLTNEEHVDLKTRLKRNRKELQKKQKGLYELKTVIENSIKHEHIRVQLDGLTTTRTSKSINDDVDALRKKERKLSSAVELSRQQSTLESQLETLPNESASEWEKKVKTYKRKGRRAKRLLGATRQVFTLQEQIEQLPTGDRSKVTKQVRELSHDIRGLAAKIKRWSRKTTASEAKLEQVSEYKEELRKLRKKVRKSRKAKRQLQCLYVLKQAFGPKGLKQDRFHAILTEATQTTIPIYTNILWPNKQVSLQLKPEEGLQFWFKRKNKKQMTRSHLLSGGESHKAGLAFILGLRDLKELYTNTGFNLLIIDEPFGNLDPQGEEALLSILELLKERFGSIFVISHRPEVIHSDVWDQTWWVIRENNESKVWLKDPPARYQRLASSYLTTEGAL